jgi:hypothetical protein
MKRIAIIAHDKVLDFSPPEPSPWSFFLKRFLDYGYEIVPLDSEPEFLINLNHKIGYQGKFLHKVKHSKRVLIVLEPSSVNPIGHSRLVQRRYGQVFVPSHMWVKRDGTRVFQWPQTNLSDIEVNQEWSTKIDKIVMIARNNFSVGRKEQYSLRRKVVAELSLDLDVFGQGWEDNAFQNVVKVLKSILLHLSSFAPLKKIKIQLHQNYPYGRLKGSTLDKFETNSRYRYSLVIENSSDYVSEKLIDAIISGTIPIYCGPNLSAFGFRGNLALEVDPNPIEIADRLSSLRESKEMQVEILQAGREFLKSIEYCEMVNRFALRNLATNIIEYFNSIDLN